jgi:hypothetical protein
MEGLEGPGAGASAAAAGSTAAAAAAAGPSKGGVSKHKRKGPKPAKLGGLQELGAAVRRLVGLRELQVTAANGYADILIPQVDRGRGGWGGEGWGERGGGRGVGEEGWKEHRRYRGCTTYRTTGRRGVELCTAFPTLLGCSLWHGEV